MSAAYVFLSGMVVGVSKTLSSSSSVHRSVEPTKKKTMSNLKFVSVFRNPSNISRTERSFRVMASGHRSEQADNSEGRVQDINYLLKLGVGSMVGAAIIKYGSVLVPEITTPSLPLALFIILTPVVISVILLIISSSSSKNHN